MFSKIYFKIHIFYKEKIIRVGAVPWDRHLFKKFKIVNNLNLIKQYYYISL